MARTKIGGPKSHPAVPKNHNDAAKHSPGQPSDPTSAAAAQKVDTSC